MNPQINTDFELRPGLFAVANRGLASMFLFVLAGLLLTGIVQAQDQKFKLGVLLDGRYILTDLPVSWLDEGLGKLRYGGENNDRRNLFRLAQASVLLNASFTDSLSAKVQVNVDSEPERSLQRRPVDIIEAYLSYHPLLSTHTRVRVRGGIFFPPISLENTGPAWTSPYTITSSAINSWIGEEVRPTGGEFTFVWSGTQNEFAVTGAIFANNDPTGSLLAWRGWAMHDRQTGYADKLPLADIPAIGYSYSLFPEQPYWTQPFREVDGRPGYYAGAAWNNAKSVDLRALYYDNRGNPTSFDGKQYGWHTKFTNAGVHLTLPARFEILAQYMRGGTEMGYYEAVHNDFYASYILVTSAFGNSRMSVRYDHFSVEDIDANTIEDNNDEHGWAWTADYLYNFNEHYRLAFELLEVDSTRPIRTALGLPPHTVETQFQTSFRFLW
jgi:hypothetical protein